MSDYSRQLRAKQQALRTYGILERQFRRYFHCAEETRYDRLNLIQTLELRLDNVVYRMGFGENRAQAARWSHMAISRQRRQG
jgi:small subunit ribosomal protein S4